MEAAFAQLRILDVIARAVKQALLLTKKKPSRLIANHTQGAFLMSLIHPWPLATIMENQKLDQLLQSKTFPASAMLAMEASSVTTAKIHLLPTQTVLLLSAHPFTIQAQSMPSCQEESTRESTGTPHQPPSTSQQELSSPPSSTRSAVGLTSQTI